MISSHYVFILEWSALNFMSAGTAEKKVGLDAWELVREPSTIMKPCFDIVLYFAHIIYFIQCSRPS